MSWWSGRKKEPDVPLQRILSDSRYQEDFAEAETKPIAGCDVPNVPQLMQPCDPLYHDLMRCQALHGESGKCGEAQLLYTSCTGLYLAPERAAALDDCIRRHGDQNMVNGVNDVSMEYYTKVKFKPFEKESLTDCRVLKDRFVASDVNEQDRTLSLWLSCLSKRMCGEEWGHMRQCLEGSGGDLEKCHDEGRPLVRCVGRLSHRLHANGEF